MALMGKDSPANVEEMQVPSLCQEDPLEREWQLTPVFLPGESHGQRRLAGHSYAAEVTWHARHSRIHKNQMELRKTKEISV